jgi:hypothetical protein
MNAHQIAKQNFESALAQASAHGQDTDALGRCFLDLVVANYLKTRSVKDVKSELLFLADHFDPDTDFMFMRP